MVVNSFCRCGSPGSLPEGCAENGLGAVRACAALRPIRRERAMIALVYLQTMLELLEEGATFVLVAIREMSATKHGSCLFRPPAARK
jgi:hypothetical protein